MNTKIQKSTSKDILFLGSTEKEKRRRDSGGVAFYVRGDLAAVNMQTVLRFTNGVIECLCLYSEIQNLFLIVVYRQPDDAIHGHPSNATHFNELLRSLTEKMRPVDSPLPDIVFGGDFNLPNIYWLEKKNKFDMH